MQDYEVFEKALGCVQKGWCRDWLALADDGWHVAPNDARATRWCVRGAVQNAIGATRMRDDHPYMELLFDELPPGWGQVASIKANAVVRFNNSRADAGPVEELLRAAIRTAKAKEGIQIDDVPAEAARAMEPV